MFGVWLIILSDSHSHMQHNISNLGSSGMRVPSNAKMRRQGERRQGTMGLWKHPISQTNPRRAQTPSIYSLQSIMPQLGFTCVEKECEKQLLKRERHRGHREFRRNPTVRARRRRLETDEFQRFAKWKVSPSAILSHPDFSPHREIYYTK